MDNSIVMGVDIGGSHITAALVDFSSKSVLTDSYHRKRIDSHASSEEIIKGWCHVIQKVKSSTEGHVSNIGLAMPGPFDYENGISYMRNQDKYEALYGLNVKELLARELGVSGANIRFINDAAGFLQGEVFAGAAAGYGNVAGLTLGTGLGSSKYKGSVAEDADMWNSPFKNSIAEEYLATRWFVRRYKELSGKEAPDAKYISERFGEDVYARQVFEEYGTNLGDFLNGFLQMEKPEILVLGGNIAKSLELFENKLRGVLQPEFKSIPIVQAKLGEEAMILGASSLWYERI